MNAIPVPRNRKIFLEGNIFWFHRRTATTRDRG